MLGLAPSISSGSVGASASRVSLFVNASHTFDAHEIIRQAKNVRLRRM